MIKTEARAKSGSMVTEIQNSVYRALEELQRRKDNGEQDIVDTYEYGFIKAMKSIDNTYGLDIDFRDYE